MKRRAFGSIDLTPNGRHRVRVPLADGRRPTLSIHDTEQEAEDALAAAVDVMRTAVPPGMTLTQWGDKWLTEREVAGHIRDVDSDWSRWRTHVDADSMGKLPLRGITRQELSRWLLRMRKKGLAAQTIRNTLNLIRVALADAVNRGFAKENGARELRVPRQKRTEHAWTFLTPDEATRLLAAFSDADRHVAAFAIGTGLRAGELCTLRLADVVREGTPRIVVRYGTPPNLSTKTGRIREVPLLGMALDALDAHRPPDENPHGLVFPRMRGGFRDPAHVLRWDAWQAAIVKAELGRDLRWHDLRHTCASSLVSGWWGRVWSLEEVRDFLGHESITTTERYAHIAGKALERAANETPRYGHRQATVRTASDVPSSEDDGGAPETTRTSDQRFRKPTLNVGISSTSLFDGPALARRILRAVASGDGTRALTLATDLAEMVLEADASERADRKTGAA